MDKLAAGGLYALILASVSCGDSGPRVTGPQNPVVSVDVLTPPTSLFVGESFQLTAVPRAASGGEPSISQVSWHSSNPAIAGVTQGLVVANAVGTADISAESAGKIGSVRIEVVKLESLVSADQYAEGTLGFTSTRTATGFDLFVVGPGGTRRVTSDADNEHFDGWSPDGASVALIRFPVDAGIFSSHVIKSNGTENRLIAQGLVNWAPDWLHRGSITDGRIVVSNADGSGAHPVGPDSPGELLFGPWWSHDGRRIAFGHSASLQVPADLYVANADGSGLLNLTSSPNLSEEYASWSPDGTRLVFTAHNDPAGIGNSIFVVKSNGADLTRLTDKRTPNGDIDPQWSPDGTRIAFTTRTPARYTMHMINASGGQAMRLTPTIEVSGFPAWSRDGTRIAFTAISIETLTQDIYVMTADRRSLVQLTRASGHNFGPFWKP